MFPDKKPAVAQSSRSVALAANCTNGIAQLWSENTELLVGCRYDTLIDSATTDHMVKEASPFCRISRIPSRSIIRGDDTTLMTEYRGDAILRIIFRAGGTTDHVRLLLKNALFVPDRQLNLIPC